LVSIIQAVIKASISHHPWSTASEFHRYAESPKVIHSYSLTVKNIKLTKMLGAGDFMRQYVIRGPTCFEIEGVNTTRGMTDIMNLEIL
jgi:hypothetical protein